MTLVVGAATVQSTPLCVLLDLSVLVQQPEVLTRRRESSIDLVIPGFVLAQLVALNRHDRRLGELSELAHAAISRGAARLEGPIAPIESLGIPGTAMGLVELAQTLATPAKKVVIATDYASVVDAAAAAGIEVLSSGRLMERMLGQAHASEALAKRARTFRVGSYQAIAGAVGVGVASMLVVWGLVWPVRFASTSPLRYFPIGVGALGVGVALFALRARRRLMYGFGELGVGVAIAGRAIASADAVTVAVVLQTFGGLYVVVRGLDNIGIGIRSTPLARYWLYLTGER